jgi:hypothetical protein
LFPTVALFPFFKPKAIEIYFNFILINKGKIIITFLISIIYRFSPSIPYFILGIILFFSSFILFIYEYVLKFESIIELLKLKGIELYNTENRTDNYNHYTLKISDTIREINPNISTSTNSSRLDIVKPK